MESKTNLWEKSKSAVVFYVYTTADEFLKFKSSVDQHILNSHLKEVKVIVLTTDSKMNIEKYSLYNYFSPNDLSIFGKIKKKNKVVGEEDLEALRLKHFDLFICFGTPTKKVAKWINGFSIPNRIGVNCENQDFFLLNLKSTLNSIQEMISFAVTTLSKIA
jgi:hypothetical protein